MICSFSFSWKCYSLFPFKVLNHGQVVPPLALSQAGGRPGCPLTHPGRQLAPARTRQPPPPSSRRKSVHPEPQRAPPPPWESQEQPTSDSLRLHRRQHHSRRRALGRSLVTSDARGGGTERPRPLPALAGPGATLCFRSELEPETSVFLDGF